MTSTTPHLGLVEATTSDPFVPSDIASNWGKIDGLPGVYLCTNSTRPTWGLSQTGMQIYETDTGLTWRWNGSAWTRDYGRGLLGVAATTANVTISGSAVLVQTTIVVHARPVLISGIVGSFSGAASVSIMRGSTQLCSLSVSGATQGVSPSYLDQPSDGTYTYALKGFMTSGNSNANAVAPTQITVVEV